MPKTIVALVGSYRKGGITDQTVDVVLDKLRASGAETKKLYLTDVPIEFCRNCRTCTSDDKDLSRGRCVIKDDMEVLIKEIEAADGLILASPVNVGTVTAVTKRFLERLVVYAYWPWGAMMPVPRLKDKTKKAIVITSSACPSFIARILMSHPVSSMKQILGLLGADVVGSVFQGMVCTKKHQTLTAQQKLRIEKTAAKLLK